MTDEPDSVDELISRYLDGEATAGEIARVERDPSLMARAAAMRVAIDAVAAPVTVPELELDRIRATALAHSTTSEQVTDLAAARARSHERRSRVFAAAAAFVFLAVGVVAIQALGGADDDDEGVATSADDESGDDSADAGAGDTDDGSDAFSAMGGAEADDSDMSADDMADADDDMAEEATAEMAPAEDEAESDAAGNDAGETADPFPFARIDLLPDDLGPITDGDELVTVVLGAYDGAVDAEGGIGRTPDDLLAELCPGAAELLLTLQAAGTAGVELSSALLGGTPTTVIVGTGVDGSIVILTHGVDDCDIVITQAVLDGP